MCTLSIVSYQCEYPFIIIGFNRDELKSRSIAYPPNVYENNSIKMIYPVDSDFGGTWWGLNESGYLFFLLNYNIKNLYKYTHHEFYNKKKSRGFIIPEFLKLTNREDIILQMKNLYCNEFAPFRFIFFDLNFSEIYLLIYNGKRTILKKFSPPFLQASSGVGDLVVFPGRKRKFDEFKNLNQFYNQIRYHFYKQDKVKPLGVVIDTPFSHTVSQTFFYVIHNKITIHYYDRIKKNKFKFEFMIKK